MPNKHDARYTGQTLVLCTGCGHQYPFGAHGKFCNNCGKAWIMGDGSSSSSTGSGGSSSNTVPSQWSGLTTFTPRSAAAVMAPLPARSYNISSLPAQVVEKARSGQQFYTLSDLLPPKAPDASAASSSLLDANAVLLRFNTSGEAMTSSAVDPSDIASLSKRRRHVTSFAEIAEVFFFSLISVIYVGRPDIQEQLIGLLSLANDINCQYSFAIALAYVDVMRRRHFASCPPRTHVLNLNSNVDMSQLCTVTLSDTINTVRLGSASSPQSSTAAGRSADNTRSSGTCRNFNKGQPCYKSPCLFAHACNTCGKNNHGSSTCNQGGGRGGQHSQQNAPTNRTGGRPEGNSSSGNRGPSTSPQSNQPGGTTT
jgi:hypothetical protein